MPQEVGYFTGDGTVLQPFFQGYDAQLAVYAVFRNLNPHDVADFERDSLAP